MNIILALTFRSASRRYFDKLPTLNHAGKVFRHLRLYFGTPSPRVFICGGVLAANFIKSAHCQAKRPPDRVSASTFYQQANSGNRRGEISVELKTPWRDIWKLVLLNVGYVIGAVVVRSYKF